MRENGHGRHCIWREVEEVESIDIHDCLKELGEGGTKAADEVSADESIRIRGILLPRHINYGRSMPFLNGPPPQIPIPRLKDWAAQVRRDEADIFTPLLVQLRRPLAPLGGGLLRGGHRLSLVRGFLPHSCGSDAEGRGIRWEGRRWKGEREKELSLGLRRKKMGERGER